jgi:hypothetical protein
LAEPGQGAPVLGGTAFALDGGVEVQEFYLHCRAQRGLRGRSEGTIVAMRG